MDESTGFQPQLSVWETASMPTYDYQVDYYTDLLRGMEECREHNGEIVPVLRQLREFDFFSLFSLDLLAGCAHFPTSEDPCELDKCEVDPADDVPEAMTARDEQEYEFELDGWARKDQASDFTEYYDLRKAPEQNTGYQGQRVWRFIHQKICFQQDLEALDSGWKRDFNRAVSGMHAAVDAQIIADIGMTDEGLIEYRRRLRDEPGSIANLYFAYMLTLCAIRDCRERLDKCNYLGDGEKIRPLIQQLTASTLSSSEPVQRAASNLREHAQSPKAAVWKARMRTRDISQVMNCVQCNLCRMHGKVMAMGLASTMQVLLGQDGRGGDTLALDRVQVGALVATAIKFGTACEIVEQFREVDTKSTTESAPDDAKSAPAA